MNTDLVSQRINLYITRPNYEAQLYRSLHNRVGGAFKVQKSFQLQQMQLSKLCKSHWYGAFLLQWANLSQFLGVLILTVNDYLTIFLLIYLYLLNFITYRHQTFLKHLIMLVWRYSIKEKSLQVWTRIWLARGINLYITRLNYDAKFNRSLHNHRVGGAFKVQKSFQLQQMQLFNSVKVIDMVHFYFSEPICPNFWVY